jgi:hypothetical protein
MLLHDMPIPPRSLDKSNSLEQNNIVQQAMLAKKIRFGQDRQMADKARVSETYMDWYDPAPIASHSK